MPFLTAEWINLLMANYEVDPALLRAHVPRGTELDEWNGVHYASLVAFLFRDTRVRGIRMPGHHTFEEVNLRFYVRYRDGFEWKRGVVFVKEIVPRRLICWVANTLYGESYVCHPMRHSFRKEAHSLHVSYEWQVGDAWNHFRAEAHAEALPLVQGSEEEFITEHYWGYTPLRNGQTGAYQVAHPSWRIHPVNSYSVDCSFGSLYGEAFGAALTGTPKSVFLAEGSPIKVMSGSRVPLARS